MNIIRNVNSQVYDSTREYYDISVCVITYNKEKYIKDTIESVLMQKTSCRYEIIVGDNFSTDGTRNILKKYWEKEPNRFALIFNNENLGLTTNMYNTLSKAKGKYIVVLYGDDYWISDEKLQRQFDFLESNLDFVGVTSAIENRYDGEHTGFKIFPKANVRNKRCTLDMYLQGKFIPMAGLMFRNDVFNENQSHFEIMLKSSLSIDDASFCILMLMMGDVFVLADVMGAYRCFRKNSKSNNFNSVNSKFERIKMEVELYNNLNAHTYNELDLSDLLGMQMASALFAVVKGVLRYSEYKELCSAISKNNKKRFMCIRGFTIKISNVLQK